MMSNMLGWSTAHRTTPHLRRIGLKCVCIALTAAMATLCAIGDVDTCRAQSQSPAQRPQAQAPPVPQSQSIMLRVKIYWQATTAIQPSGALTIDQGALSDLRNLSLAAGSTGGLDLSGDRSKIYVSSREASLEGGFEFNAFGTRQSVLNIGIFDTGHAKNLQSPGVVNSPVAGASVALDSTNGQGDPNSGQSVTLGELLDGPRALDFVQGRVRLIVERPPSDRLQVHFDRRTLIFQPGESVPARVTPVATGVAPNQTLTLLMTITSARSSKPIIERRIRVESDADGVIPPVDIGPLTMPENESAYNLQVRLSPERRYLNLEIPWSNHRDDISRTVQFVVLADEQPIQPTQGFAEIARIEPTRRQWWNPSWAPDRLIPETINTSKFVPDSIPSIVGNRHQSLASGPLEHAPWNDRQITRLAPQGWLAYPLEINEPGKPHMLVVRYPSDRSMRLGASVLEPNAAGQVQPLGIDTGVLVTHHVVVKSPQLLEHRVVFWPKTRHPLVLLTNFSSTQPAWFADLSILAGPDRLPVASNPHTVAHASTVDSSTVDSSGGAASGGGAGDARGRSQLSGDQSANRTRLAALYLDKPVLADTFGCSKILDPKKQLLIEDWQTFLDAGNRLVQYVQWAGYNGAIVTVASEGATLYPTELMSVTPRYDMGVFSVAGMDPTKKDVLELLFRLFDRARLRFVPAIELASPLTRLERELRKADVPAGIEPVNSLGHRYVDIQRIEHGLTHYYNPLDARVSSAIAEVAMEIQNRYGHHESFEALGLHIGGTTYLQLPGVDWGYDATTLASFAKSTGGAPRSTSQLMAWLAGEGRTEFLAWRGRKLAQMFGRISDNDQHREVLLLTADWMPAGSQENIDPQRRALEMGLDWESLSGAKNIVPMRLHRDHPLADHMQQNADASLNEKSLWDKQLASFPTSGGLLMRPPTDVRVAGFEAVSPWGADKTNARLLAHGVPSEDHGASALALMMRDYDLPMMAVGGWTTPRGCESSTRTFLQCYGQLPRGRFESVQAHGDAKPQLTSVRHFATPDAYYVYALNSAPWSVHLQLDIDNPDSAPIESLHPEIDDPQAGRTVSQLLPPGQLIAYRIASPSASVTDWSVEIPGLPALHEHLGNQLQGLLQVIGMLGQPQPFDRLANAQFEAHDAASAGIPGWLVAQHPADCVRVAPGQGIDQSAAIELHGDGGSSSNTWLLSHPFDAPTTGRLMVGARVRRSADAAKMRLRMSLEGRYHDRSIRRSLNISEQESNLPATDWSSMPFQLEVTDLPVEGLEELRIAFDLAGQGKVWIDNIQLFDQFLTVAERKDLKSHVFVAVEQLRKGDLSECGRLLDSYWGRYLMSLREAATDNQAALLTPPSSSSTGDSAERSSNGIAERLRQWLPSPIWR